MKDETPQSGLRLLASLIAADLRAGSPALATEPTSDRGGQPRRGRKTTEVVAVVARPSLARAA